VPMVAFVREFVLYETYMGLLQRKIFGGIFIVKGKCDTTRHSHVSPQ
jgi:hypothetical protein